MKTKTLKLLSVLQAFILVIGMCTFIAPMKADAAGLGVTTSASYQSGVYYQRACEAYSKYSDPRIRMVQVALSQKGYKGGTKSGDWAGNGGGGKQTEYGRFMGKNGMDWCASFVSWCAAAAGIPTNVIPRSALAGHWRSAGTGTYTPIWSNGYTTYNPYKPQVGDFCLYMPYCETCRKHYNAPSPSAHVVIVAAVAETQNANGSWTFTTIERGNNNTVESHKINTKSTRGSVGTCTCGKQSPAGTYSYVVQGFWRPNWSLVSGGNTGGNTSDVVEANVKLTVPTQSEYVAKEFVDYTNACMVTQITKPAGTTVSQCGIVLMDANGTVLKNYSENISNVGKNTTLFHSWYDINEEVGYTLKEGTTYKYKFFTVVDGVRYEGATRSFVTKGDAYYNVFFNANGGSCSTVSMQIKSGGYYGELPVPTRTGYEFIGWYTKQNDGMEITANTYFSGSSDVTIYARWTAEEKKTCTIGYDPHGGVGRMNTTVYEYGETVTVEDCQFTNSGKEFYTWVLYRSADEAFYTPKNGWHPFDVLEKNKYGLEAFDPGESLIVNEEFMEGCDRETMFYFVAVWQDAEQEEEYEEEYEESYEEQEEVVIKLYIDNPRMRVNRTTMDIDSQGTAPCIINGRTMIPIRALIEAMGGTVSWNGTLRQVTLTLDGKTLYLRIGENYAFDQNNTYALDSAPVLTNGRTLLPVRAVVEYFGGSVSWNSSARCVTINYRK
ncbi:MAG: InlB B-repeat-containing protein [Clostridia bacterium]|nr:InlB B-repeat-containing protein [Clostridia bacterium]